ncbi:hypothetical protein HZS_7746 [Henneguya salminicola]|nr:hypothetical protein HZS_7746 [Henneguya salminicola]
MSSNNNIEDKVGDNFKLSIENIQISDSALSFTLIRSDVPFRKLSTALDRIKFLRIRLSGTINVQDPHIYKPQAISFIMNKNTKISLVFLRPNIKPSDTDDF